MCEDSSTNEPLSISQVLHRSHGTYLLRTRPLNTTGSMQAASNRTSVYLTLKMLRLSSYLLRGRDPPAAARIPQRPTETRSSTEQH